MAKYYGKVGYTETLETKPGVWEEHTIERAYFGDTVAQYMARHQSTDQLNDNINVTNSISIVADPYAYNNFQNIRWIEYSGAKWKVNSVEVKFPRLVLSLGGVYNEQEN